MGLFEIVSRDVMSRVKGGVELGQFTRRICVFNTTLDQLDNSHICFHIHREVCLSLALLRIPLKTCSRHTHFPRLEVVHPSDVTRAYIRSRRHNTRDQKCACKYSADSSQRRAEVKALHGFATVGQRLG